LWAEKRSAIGRKGDFIWIYKIRKLALVDAQEKKVHQLQFFTYFNSWISETARSFLGDRSEASIY